MSDAPTTPAAATGVEAFAAFITRYHTDATLRRLHFARLVMGIGGALVVVLFNHFRLSGPGAEEIVTRIATVVCTLHVVACLVTLFLARQRFLADIRRHAGSLKDRAWQVAQFVQRRGNVLLLLAATGHVLVVVGTEFRLRMFAPDGGILLVALVPSLLLLLHGLGEIPTRERLVRLYARITGEQPSAI
jgi:hypothetical protein